MLKENLKVVQQKILNACEKSGRKREDVTLIAVSKTKPVEMIREIMSYGIIDFGENKVQELVSKTEIIDTPLNWHLIGHLQTNKVKYIVDKACLIHSVDSLKLANVIQTECEKRQVIMPILLEVNIAKEDTKYGLLEHEVLDVISEISNMPNIDLKGLMTIAPFVANPEENRIHFRNLRKLYVDIKTKNIDNIHMSVLSMGMTNDYEVAIEEGATMVRVGTGIFGKRNYNIV